MCLAGDAARGPDQHLLQRGVVQQWWYRGQLDARRQRQRVGLDLRLRRLQRPLPMLDLAAIDALAVRGVEAVALGEEVRKRAGAWTAGRPGGTVAQEQIGGRLVMIAPAGVRD